MMKIDKKQVLSLTLLAICSISKIKPMEYVHLQKGGEFNNPLVANLEIKFNQIVQDPAHLATWNNDKIIPYPYYRYTPDSELKIHFQSIVRFPEHLGLGQYLAISGGNSITNHSELFLIKMNSQNQTGLWLSNLDNKNKPPKTDSIFARIIIDNSGYWHAGGMQVCGKHLAIPIEDKKNSKIVFYNISPLRDQELPRKLNVSIKRRNRKAGAVALAKMKSGHFIVAVWSDKYGFDFYVSKNKSLRNFKFIVNVEPKKLVNKRTPKYQMINFIQTWSGDLYLVGTDNPSKAAPVINKRNLADLFKCNFDTDGKISIRLKGTKLLNVHHTSNFDAGCGFYATSEGNICIYSCHHYLSEKSPNGCQYLNCFKSPKIKTFLTIDQY